jgi:hypothetical protein
MFTGRALPSSRHAPANRIREIGIAIAIACALVVPSASAQSHFRLESRVLLDQRLKSFSDDNQLREQIIRKWLAESGCAAPNLSSQPVRVDLPPNVICVLPGATREEIVVGAHTDKVTKAGDGVVDNWSGAALLPGLLFSLNGQKRHHTFVFIGFTGEESGLIGSEYYVAHLSPAERAQIEAMVNMDSLGLTSTKVWASHADTALLDALTGVAAKSKLPLSTANVDNLGTTDSESFGRYHIPRITLHSVTLETIHVLHSDEDNLAAVNLRDYYESYQLIADYLAYLDRVLKPPAAKQVSTPHPD